jgi:hypothetical protein
MTPKASLFLATYLEMWSIAEAAKRSGVSRAAHYKRLERDPRYREAFEDLQETIRDTIRDEIRRRAIDGWDEPVIYREKKCDTIRKYSDRLLILLAKAHCPEFRDSHSFANKLVKMHLKNAATRSGIGCQCHFGHTVRCNRDRPRRHGNSRIWDRRSSSIHQHECPDIRSRLNSSKISAREPEHHPS